MFFSFGRSPPTVLVIEDDKSLQRLISARLARKHKHTVIQALDGEKGLKKATSEKPDLIILDWVLPGLAGPEVLRRLKAISKTRNIPVLMMTAKNKVGEIEDIFKLGANAYVTKPFSLTTLSEKVLDLLAR